MTKETVVLIVGAGPSGLSTSASLNVLKIPNIVLEMEDCCASLWKKHSYERLNLHLTKKFCQLPHMSFPPNAPPFLSKSDFIQYLDNYASHFKIHPFYNRLVQSATFNPPDEKWLVLAKNKVSGKIENYVAKFFVVATGENSRGNVPNIPGLQSFAGEVMHSNLYENGKKFENKDVLVVGCGNSGMEIAHDLLNSGAKCSIVIRHPVHVLTKEIMQLGMVLLQFFPCSIVDIIVDMLAQVKYGNLSRFGLQRPTDGPFHRRAITGQPPVIDVGTINDIKAGDIQVFPSMQKIDGDCVEFENGETKRFDAIIFATGYRSTVRDWLKDDDILFNEDGKPKKMKPNHWKGENGLYCAGFAGYGLFGIAADARNIASDIAFLAK